jgi:hypothetical protein
MASAKWSVAADRGIVISSANDGSGNLYGLANGSRTNAGAEINNSSNLDEYGWLELVVTFGSAPSTGGYVGIYMLTSPNGINYEDGSTTVDPGAHTWVCNIPVKASTSAQRVRSPLILLHPFKTKFIALNGTGVAFPSTTASEIRLWTTYEVIS